MSAVNAEDVAIHVDLSAAKLAEIALARHEAELSSNGAICAVTGSRTGRSPKDRFIVNDSLTAHTVDWGAVNQPFPPEKFNQLWDRVTDYLDQRETFVSHCSVGADPHFALAVDVRCEYAWHTLFANTLFIRDGKRTSDMATWQLVSAPEFKCDPERDGTASDGCVILNFSEQKVLVAGMRYAGEMKKAMFSVMNYLMPLRDVLPMHCAANVSSDKQSALFFGLSGTGKTTLSADPDRFLIGDDEHGWSPSGVFNFEGGCYAKCIDLTREREQIIWDAIREGAIMENVVLDPVTRAPDYTNVSLTQNTRAAYPREHIAQRVLENRAGIPEHVLFLTCDLYGVLPPVSVLTPEQAAYYFLSGYTALVGSTEVGSTTAVKPTFSTCFGAPFFPRPARVYADLLIKRIAESQSTVYLVNTGWTGGAYGQGGKRFDIPTTRRVVSAILNNELFNAKLEKLPGFNLAIPVSLTGVDSALLDPRKTWQSSDAYEQCAKNLRQQFRTNFAKFAGCEDIQAAGPSD